MKRKSLLLSIPLALSLGLCGCNVQAEVEEPAVSGSVSDNTGVEEEKEPEAQAVNVDEMFTVPDMFEITLHNAEWKDALISGDPNGFNITYGEDEADSTYLVINATIKNIGATNESLGIGLNSSSHLGAAFKINDKYEIDARGTIPLTGDRIGTDYEIEPMKTAEVQFYASVSDEIKNAFEGVELTLAARQPNEEGVWEMDKEPIGTYVANFQ